MIYWERAGKVLGMLRDHFGDNVQMVVEGDIVRYEHRQGSKTHIYSVHPDRWHDRNSQAWADHIATCGKGMS